MIRLWRRLRLITPLGREHEITRGIGDFDLVTEQYWVGATGDDGAMPPEIAALLDPFRTVTV